MKRTCQIGDWARTGVLVAAALAVSAASAAAQDFEMTEQQFNSWLTNGSSSPEDQASAQAEMELRALEQLCGLAEEQREKLELAARGDVTRFESSIAQLRDELVGNTFNQNEINEVYQRIQPFARQYQKGLLGEESLFQKCLLSTLDARQFEKYDEAQFQRRCVQYDAKVRMYVGILERSLPMTHRQRTKLVDHLLATTYPPRRFGSQDLYYVMYQASESPVEELKNDFDDAQMKVLRAAFRQGKSYGPMTKQQGYEPDERRASGKGVSAASKDHQESNLPKEAT